MPWKTALGELICVLGLLGVCYAWSLILHALN